MPKRDDSETTALQPRHFTGKQGIGDDRSASELSVLVHSPLLIGFESPPLRHAEGPYCKGLLFAHLKKTALTKLVTRLH